MISPVLPKNVLDNNSELNVKLAKEKENFRNYVDSDLQDRVANTYRKQHTFQTYEYASIKKEQFGFSADGEPKSYLEMSIWEAAEKLNEIIDESDPDVDIPQIHHLLQTAEAIRKAYPGEEWDWFHLTGFIHDLGKLLLLADPGFSLPQWATVGDTFPVGCKFSETNVFPEYFKQNPDYNDARYNTECGVYQPGCGLKNILMCWGHDEYMYQVCLGNKSTLPPQALYMIRFHSFYPWHRYGAYTQLANEEDAEMLKWVLEFNKFDLYSKEEVKVDAEKLRPYYESLAKKYFPEKVKFPCHPSA